MVTLGCPCLCPLQPGHRTLGKETELLVVEERVSCPTCHHVTTAGRRPGGHHLSSVPDLSILAPKECLPTAEPHSRGVGPTGRPTDGVLASCLH